MFENVLGNRDKIGYLEKSVENNNISHAYLFEGKEGIGKCLVAKEFAKTILNVDNLDASPDYTYINREKDKKDIVVEQIRSKIIDDAYMVPSAANYKVYVIDDAQNLNAASQNALLKTLEEPPYYVVIILIASNTKTFLPTILSRVNRVSFEPILKNELRDYIDRQYGLSFSESILNYIDGSIGLAKKLVHSDLKVSFEKIDRLYESIISRDVIGVFKFLKEIDFNQDNLLGYLESKLFEKSDFPCIKHVEKAKQRLKNNGNYDIVIDTMILKIIDEI